MEANFQGVVRMVVKGDPHQVRRLYQMSLDDDIVSIPGTGTVAPGLLVGCYTYAEGERLAQMANRLGFKVELESLR